MFHVMLALPAFGALAILGTVVLWILFALLQGSFWGTLLLGIFCKKHKWLISLPALLGVVGCVVCLMLDLLLESGIVLAYWGVYLLAALIGYGIACLVRCIMRWILK